MTYYYVKSGGTATGTVGYSSPKTGSWSTAFTDPSQYYGSIYSVVTSITEVDGDVILVSNQHNGFTTFPSSNGVLSGSSDNVFLVSINDLNLVEPLIGAKESYSYLSGSLSFSIYFHYVYGLTFEVQSNTSYFNFSSPALLESCTFLIPGYADARNVIWNYSYNQFLNCTFNLGTNSSIYNSFFTSGGYHWIFKNCTFIAPENINSYLFSSSNNGSASALEFEGCDFSKANLPLISPDIPGTGDGFRTFVNLYRCIESTNLRYNGIYAGIADPSGFYYSGSKQYLSTQYYALGIVDCDTSVYRTDGPEYISGEYFSYKVTSNNAVSFSAMFSFKLLDFYLDTSTTKTFTVELAQVEGSSLLTDYEFSIDIYYITNVSYKSYRQSTSKILPSSNNLSTSSKTWTGLTNPVKQYVSLTTSQTGSYGLCSVYVNIFVPNRTIYICPKVDIT